MNTNTNGGLNLFAVTAPGLERLCAAELAVLGIAGTAGDGGVAWRGGPESLYRANLELRTASRVIARLGTFRARTFPELERHAARLPWRSFVKRGAAVALRVTSRKSKLFHTGAVAERIARVLTDQLGARVDAVKGDDDDDVTPDARLVVVRFIRDECTISVDSSGALLHQRGYRQAVGRAPLRETIAAALLLGSGWRGTSPLLDPLCGSGTIAIEAALIARRIAPGLAGADRAPRRFAFQSWPGHDPRLLDDVVAAARGRILPAAAVPIIAADRNAGAVTAARSNAARAGVERDIEIVQRPLSGLTAPAAAGHLVTNPPYGVRVGERSELDALYAALGRTATERLAGWCIVLLAAEPRLAAATALPLRELFATRNGGIAVRALCARCDPAALDAVASGDPQAVAGYQQPDHVTGDP